MAALARDFADYWQHNEQSFLNDFLRRHHGGSGPTSAPCWDHKNNCLKGTGQFQVVVIPPPAGNGRTVFEIHAIDGASDIFG